VLQADFQQRFQHQVVQDVFDVKQKHHLDEYQWLEPKKSNIFVKYENNIFNRALSAAFIGVNHKHSKLKL